MNITLTWPDGRMIEYNCLNDAVEEQYTHIIYGAAKRGELESIASMPKSAPAAEAPKKTRKRKAAAK